MSIARGQSLTSVMDDLCRRVERLAPDVVCSILRVDEEGCLRHLAGPSLPDHYRQAIDGVAIGPNIGSCGTAAFHAGRIEVVNIATDPLWKDFKALALPLGLQACWSSPIVAHDQKVIGTFAFYFRTPRGASTFERDVVATSVHLCAIAIEQWQTHKQINQLAFHDPLTRLGNRAMLKDRLGGILETAAKTSKRVALLYLDLDGFKAINDLHGHAQGDELLCQIANKLSAIAENADLIVRLGGDEFLVVASASGENDGFEALAEKLLAGINGRYQLGRGLDAAVGVSIGVACYPEDGGNMSTLVAHADTALYRVKNEGRRGYAFFDSAMEREQRERRALERDVCLALEAGQLSLVYQPLADMRFDCIEGFEALLRWHHPQRGMVSPADFIPAAESCGAIGDIGAFALREACREAATWPARLRIGVNASPAQIVHADFAGLVEQILAETGLDPRRLEIEVTESLFIRDAHTALQTLQRLHGLGVSVAIDDFGTGFSSLGTLRSFPFDRIKIDRSFVRTMALDTDDAAIVNSVLGLGRAMALLVVAEGVETHEQLQLLRQLGCHHVQGYLIGKPLPIGAYTHITNTPPMTAVKAIKRPA
ncbi:MAG: EAL domain-containing protein [Sphingomonadales bacterium]|nr:EAL domain-containing protein [Sphingomonadales bacterium]